MGDAASFKMEGVDSKHAKAVKPQYLETSSELPGSNPQRLVDLLVRHLLGMWTTRKRKALFSQECSQRHMMVATATEHLSSGRSCCQKAGSACAHFMDMVTEAWKTN